MSLIIGETEIDILSTGNCPVFRNSSILTPDFLGHDTEIVEDLYCWKKLQDEGSNLQINNKYKYK